MNGKFKKFVSYMLLTVMCSSTILSDFTIYSNAATIDNNVSLVEENNVDADLKTQENDDSVTIIDGDTFDEEINKLTNIETDTNDKVQNEEIINDNIQNIESTNISTLYLDGTLILNEYSNERENNIKEHGEVLNTYEFDLENTTFEKSEDAPWYLDREKIYYIVIGNDIKPISCNHWFNDMPNIINVYLDKLDFSETQSIDYMFTNSGDSKGCDIFYLNLPNNLLSETILKDSNFHLRDKEYSDREIVTLNEEEVLDDIKKQNVQKQFSPFSLMRTNTYAAGTTLGTYRNPYTNGQWKKDGSDWYYEVSGKRVVPYRWIKDKDGNMYHTEANSAGRSIASSGWRYIIPYVNFVNDQDKLGNPEGYTELYAFNDSYFFAIDGTLTLPDNAMVYNAWLKYGNDDWSLVAPDGKCYTGCIKGDYFFDMSGEMQKGLALCPDGYWRIFKSSGNSQTIKSGKSYKTGQMIKSDTVTENGKTYNVDANGHVKEKIEFDRIYLGAPAHDLYRKEINIGDSPSKNYKDILNLSYYTFDNDYFPDKSSKGSFKRDDSWITLPASSTGGTVDLYFRNVGQIKGEYVDAKLTLNVKRLNKYTNDTMGVLALANDSVSLMSQGWTGSGYTKEPNPFEITSTVDIKYAPYEQNVNKPISENILQEVRDIDQGTVNKTGTTYKNLEYESLKFNNNYRYTIPRNTDLVLRNYNGQKYIAAPDTKAGTDGSYEKSKTGVMMESSSANITTTMRLYACGSRLIYRTNNVIPLPPPDTSKGSLQIIKTSTGNRKVPLSGAQYTVYSDKQLNRSVGTLTTTTYGSSNMLSLTPGTYYIKETKAPNGYKLDATVHTAQVVKNDIKRIWLEDEPSGSTPDPKPTPGQNDKGYIKIQKKSGNPSLTNGKPKYSLSGAIYGIYSDRNCRSEITRLTTNSSGVTSSYSLKPGTYYIKEIKAPSNYNIDTKVYEKNVSKNQTVTVESIDQPKQTTPPPSEKYKVTYKANGGTGYDVIDNVTYGQSYTVRDNMFTRSGYRFNGWNTNQYGNGENWTSKINHPFTWNKKSNVILYAQWIKDTTPTPSEKYTITYKPNGGTGRDVTDNVTYGQSYTVRNNMFTRTGYTFKGWNTNSNGTGQDWTYRIGNPFAWNVKNNVILYAQWTKNEVNPPVDKSTYGKLIKKSNTGKLLAGAEYRIYTKDKQYPWGGAVTETPKGNFITNSNGESIVKLEPDTYYIKETKAPKGYKIDTSEHSFTVTTSNTKDNPAPITVIDEPENVTPPVEKYTITYKPNGGTGYDVTDNVTYGQSYTVRDNMFTRTGYTFKGWNTNSSGTGQDWTYRIGNPFTWNVKNNVILYAQWIKDAPPVDKTTYGKLIKQSANTDITSGDNRYSLSGAKYKVYTKEKPNFWSPEQEVFVGEFVTDVNGESKELVLKPGNYFVKETLAPKGYEIDTKEYNLSVLASNTKENPAILNVKDTPKIFANPKGYAQLIKTSSNTDLTNNNPNYSLEGAVYGVYEEGYNGTKVGEFRTEANGQSNKLYLEVGRYSVKEISAPKGYEIDNKTYTIIVNETNTFNVPYILRVTETPIPPRIEKGFLQINKISSNIDLTNGNPDYSLQGAVYGIYKDYNCYNEKTRVETNQYGKTISVELEVGTYYVKEISAPKNYKIDPKVYTATVSTKHTSYYPLKITSIEEPIIKEPDRGYLQLNKKSNNPQLTNNNPNYSLKDAVFGVYTDYDCQNKVGDLRTDINGVSNSLFLDVGIYYVKEISAPKGFEMDKAIHQIKVEKNNSMYNPSIVNVTDIAQNNIPIIKNGYLQINKTSTNPELTNGNSKYSLNGAIYGIYKDYNCYNEIKRVTTDQYGKTALVELEVGTYYVKEISAPKNYKIDSTVYTVSISKSNTAQVPLKVNVKDEPIIQGPQKCYLQIIKESTSIGMLPGGGGSMAGAHYDIYKDEQCNQKIGEFITQANGLSNIIELPNVGTYYLKETIAPNGYRLDNRVHACTVNGSGTSTNPEQVTMYDTPKGFVRNPAYLKIKKSSNNPTLTNGNDKYSLSGAVYGVYKDRACTEELGRLITDAKGETDILEVEPSMIIYGDRGNRFVKEIKAPKGYELDTTVYAVPLRGRTHTETNPYILEVKDTPIPMPYKVTYNANGGVGNNVVDEIFINNNYTTKNNMFTKNGYTFVGWNTDPNGKGEDWTSKIGKPFVWNINKDVTLYAQWKADEYTITYKANGGNGNDIIDKIVYQDYYVTRENMFNRYGYTFVGWNTDPNGQGEDWTGNIGQSIQWNKKENVILYAQWKANKYTVTYKANGGIGTDIVDSVSYNQSYTTRDNMFSKVGYTFVGWNTNPYGNGENWTSRIKHPFNWSYNENIILYAQWKPNTYKVTYKANGGVGEDVIDSVVYEGSYVTKDNMFNKNGYTFIGWNTDASGNAEDWTYRIGKPFTWKYQTNITLYAQWKPNDYKITYKANGGSGNDVIDYVSYNADYTTRENMFTRTGYTFVGWNTAANGQGESWTDYIGNPFKWTMKKNVILYAQWKPNIYKVTYKANGGVGTDVVDNVKFDSSYTTRENMFTKTGYTFVGWSTDPYGTGENWTSKINHPFIWKYTNNITLYAQWKPNTYKVTYKANGGVGKDVVDTVTYGSLYTVKENMFTNKGKNFVGWNTSAIGNGEDWTSYINYTFNWNYTSNLILYAQWNSNQYKNGHSLYVYGFKNGEGNNENKTAYLLDYTYKTYNYNDKFVINEELCPSTKKIPNGFELNTFVSTKYNPDGSDSGRWHRETFGTEFTQNTSNMSFEFSFSPILYNVTYKGLEGATNNNPTDYNVLYGFSLKDPGKREGYTFDGWYLNNQKITGINAGLDNHFKNPDDLYLKLSQRLTGDKVIEARWSSNNYKVTYNANGGNGKNIVDNVKFNSKYTTKENMFTKEGYTFEGWNTDPNGQGEDWTSKINNPFTWKYTKDVTLYAQWKANEYKVTYNANGGVGHDVVDNITFDSSYTTRNNMFNKTGYTFVGWNTQPTGNGENWTSKINHPFIWKYTKNITLYAQWKPNTYTITYKANGGVGKDIVDKVTYNTVYTVKENMFTREGYTFDGWNLSSDGNGEDWTYRIGNSFNWMYDKNITLYAQWSTGDYKITYKPNGALGNDVINKISYDASYTVKDNMFKYDGYTFVGWNTDPNGKGEDWTTKIGKSFTWKYTNDVTLYAQWKANEYTVTYKANGGVGHDVVDNVVYNTMYTVKNNMFTRKGYNFVGWNTSPDGTGEDWTDKINVPNKWTYSKDIILYAQWTKGGYKVVYKPNGGVGQDVVDNVNFDNEYTVKNNMFTRKGYTFVGWNTKSDGQGEDWTSKIGNPFVWKYEKNITLYAQWKANSYTVTYKPNGGIGNDVLDNVKYDVNYTVRDNVFTRDGYTFIGWNTNPNGQGENWTSKIGNPFVWKYTKNVTLYAQWNIKTYKNSASLWAFGFKENEGNNGNKTAFRLGDLIKEYKYGEKFTVNKTTSPRNGEVPKGYELRQYVGGYFTPNGVNSGKWHTEPFGTTFMQNDSNMSFEYDAYPIQYNVTYTGLNGATNSNPTSYNVLYGFELKNPGLREGYTFDGWYLDGKKITGINANLSNNFKDADDLYAKLNQRTIGDKTIEARWKTNTYTVTYKANGGVGKDIKDNISYNSKYTVKDNMFNKNGYTFIGWNTNPNGQGEDWTSKIGNPFTWKYKKDVILYAQWKEDTGVLKIVKKSENPTLTDGNESFSLANAVYGVYTDYECKEKVSELKTNANGETNTVELKVGTYYVKELIAPKGYELDTSVYTVKITTKSSLENSDETILNVLDKPKYEQYKITYNANGGIGDDVVDNVIFNQSYTVRDNMFEHNEADFGGWNTQPDGSGEDWSSKIGIPALWIDRKDITLYAQWDYKPEIIAPDKEYYEGETVTKEDLLKDVTSSDKEDGVITEKVKIKSIEYAPGRVVDGKRQPGKTVSWEDDMPNDELLDTWFMELAKEDGFVIHKVTYEVIDSFGHITKVIANVKVKYNNFPEIIAEDRVFDLEYAQSGQITKDILLTEEVNSEKTKGTDIEEGNLSDKVIMLDFKPTDFTKLKDEAIIPITLHVQDSMGPDGKGKETIKSFKVIIVKNDVPDEEKISKKTLRFISKKYYNINKDGADLLATSTPDNGGLQYTSKWYLDPEYSLLLEGTFDKTKGTTYSFTPDNVKAIKDYVTTHGMGNEKESDALTEFRNQFM